MNMKKIILLLCIGFSFTIPLYAWEGIDYTVEARVSYFRPFSKRLREVYQNGWANYEIQASQTFCNGWTIWEGVSGWPVNGRSTCLHNKTHMRLWGLKLGVLRQFYCTPCLRFYLGAGGTYNFLRIHDKSHFVREHFSKNNFGAVVQTGIYYFLNQYCFLDINFQYLYQRFHFSRHRQHVPKRDVDLSGLQIGGGLGILF